MLRKIVSPRVVAALQYIKAAEKAFAAARAAEAKAEDERTPFRKRGELREAARALRHRGLELQSRGENKMRAIRRKWPI